jgi:eukaryotic-like serine/threonine-protein kinase
VTFDRLIRVVIFLGVFFAHYSFQTEAWQMHIGTLADAHGDEAWTILSLPLFAIVPRYLQPLHLETLLFINSFLWAAAAAWLSSFLPVRRMLRHWSGRRAVPGVANVHVPAPIRGPQRSSPKPGARTFGNGRYEVIARIGKGASGTVYRARDHIRGLDVAIKTLNLESIPPQQREAIRSAFQQEASRAGQLDHHGIVAAFDHDATAPEPYIVMSLVKGGTLRGRLDALPRGKHLDWLEVVKIGEQVAAALDYARHHGVKAHRDIKPANIFCGDAGYKVGDFGLTSLRLQPKASSPAGGGTPGYMAPEQMLTPQAVDWRADLFALCAVLYEALAGMQPFADINRERRPGKVPAAIPSIVAAASADLTPLHELVPDIPGHVAGAIERGLQFERANRFASWDEFIIALRGEAR